MKHDFFCRGKRVMLSPLEEEDMEALRLLRNKERLFFMSQEIISYEMQQQWYKSYGKKTDDIMFKISLLEEPDVFIGSVALYNIRYGEKECEIGRILIDIDKFGGQGIGKEAYALACAFAFNELKMEKIVAECRKENKRALHVYKKIGMRIDSETEEVFSLLLTNDLFIWENVGL